MPKLNLATAPLPQNLMPNLPQGVVDYIPGMNDSASNSNTSYSMHQSQIPHSRETLGDDAIIDEERLHLSPNNDEASHKPFRRVTKRRYTIIIIILIEYYYYHP